MKSPSTIMTDSKTVPAARPAPSTLASLRPRSSVSAIRMIVPPSRIRSSLSPRRIPRRWVEPVDADKSVPLNIRKRIGDVEGRGEQREQGIGEQRRLWFPLREVSGPKEFLCCPPRARVVSYWRSAIGPLGPL